jgi:hypothetical protein
LVVLKLALSFNEGLMDDVEMHTRPHIGNADSMEMCVMYFEVRERWGVQHGLSLWRIVDLQVFAFRGVTARTAQSANTKVKS